MQSISGRIENHFYLTPDSCKILTPCPKTWIQFFTFQNNPSLCLTENFGSMCPKQLNYKALAIAITIGLVALSMLFLTKKTFRPQQNQTSSFSLPNSFDLQDFDNYSSPTVNGTRPSILTKEPIIINEREELLVFQRNNLVYITSKGEGFYNENLITELKLADYKGDYQKTYINGLPAYGAIRIDYEEETKTGLFCRTLTIPLGQTFFAQIRQYVQKTKQGALVRAYSNEAVKPNSSNEGEIDQSKETHKKAIKKELQELISLKLPIPLDLYREARTFFTEDEIVKINLILPVFKYLPKASSTSL